MHSYPCAPCCYCGRLLYPLKAVWVCRNSNSRFPFEELYPDVALLENLKRPNTFASCRACRNPPRKRCLDFVQFRPKFRPYPMGKENIFLSFIYLHTTCIKTVNYVPKNYYINSNIIGRLDFGVTCEMAQFL